MAAAFRCDLTARPCSGWTENFFRKLKEFKRIAIPADKTDRTFAAIINLAATVIATR